MRRQQSNNDYIGHHLTPGQTQSNTLSPANRQSLLAKGLGIRSSMFLTQTQHRTTHGKMSKTNSQSSLASAGGAISNSIYSLPATQPNSNTNTNNETFTSNFSQITADTFYPGIDPTKSASTMLSSYKHDSLDTFADCCCSAKKCIRCRLWIHNLDRIYLAILIVVMLSLTAGCSFASFWYFYGATEQTNNAMELAIQSIGDRTRNQLTNQFWIPQLFTGYLLAGLQTKSYTVDAAQSTEGIYDRFFISALESRHTETLFSLHMYNVNDNMMIGSYLDPRSNTTMIRTVVNDSVVHYVYDAVKGNRLSVDTTSDSLYIARERPWFIQSQKIEFGVSSWTEPYIFSELDGVYGMTLITRIDYDDTEVILLVEITMVTLDSAIAVDYLPIDTLLFVLTPKHSIISATNGELVIQDTTDGDSDELECVSADAMTCETLEHFSKTVFELQRDNIDLDMDGYIYVVDDDDGVQSSLSIYGFPFYMVYVDQMDNSAAHNANYEVGFIVISYKDSYLNNIYLSFYASWIILVIMMIVSCTIVCCNVKTDQKRQKKAGFRSISIQTERRNESLMTFSLFNSTHSSNRFKSNKKPDVDAVITEEQEPEEDEESFSITEEKDARVDDKFINVTIAAIDEHKENKETETDTNNAMLLSMALGNTSDGSTKDVVNQNSADIIQEEKEAEPQDNVLNLPITTEAPDPDPDDVPTQLKTQRKYPSAQSIDSTAPLKDDNTTSLPDSVPSNKKMVSFETDSVLPIPQPTINKQDSELFEIVDKYTNKCCNCSPITIIIVSVCLIWITYMMVIGVWVYGTNITSVALVDDLMVKEEYLEVTDEVYKLFDSSDMIYDILSRILKTGKLELDQQTNDCTEKEQAQNHADFFYTKLMKAFTESNGKYRQYYIYTATPSGIIHGARWRYSADNTSLAIGSRSVGSCGSPDPKDLLNGIGAYEMYDVDINTGLRVGNAFEETFLYDPRCTSWYINAIKHGFIGTITQAFKSRFKQFYEGENTPALQTTECLDAREEYVALFNLSAYINGEYIDLNSTEATSFILNEDKSVDDLYIITWDRYEFASLKQGLTASGVVTDELTGDLIGVIAVDYTLEDLSSVLHESVGNGSDWFAWIFEANSFEPYVIASSDGLVLVSADSIDGCLQLAEENEEILISATEHDNKMIRLMSKEIVDVYSIDSVNNISIAEGTGSMSVKVPIDLPKLEVGRIQYYQDILKQSDSIDWIIAKTINTSDIESGESNDLTISFMMLSMLITVTMITFREFKVNKLKKDDNNNKQQQKYDEEDLEELEYNAEDRLGYFRKMKKMKHIVEGSANILWKLSCDDFDGIITTQKAKDFMAQRANQHVSANENNSFMFLMCSLEYRNKWNRLKFFEIMDSDWYSISMQFIIILHLIMTIFEPSTPQQLASDGTHKYILLSITICIICEFIDLVLIGVQRYMEFTLNAAILKQLYQLNFGIEHKYCIGLKKNGNNAYWLIFFGPKSNLFLCHITVFVLILFNFVLQLTVRISPFGYYIPILPVLILLKNQYILSFLSEFFFAINFARDVLFSYLCFILIFAMFGISLFGKTVRETESADSFRSIRQAFITSFVYISTSENYDDIVYATIDSEYYGSQHWIILANVIFICIIFVILGLFIFIPMIIHKFEEAFSERKILRETDNNNEKQNAIIAAFIMLDMNGDMGIDMDEFQHLVTHSILINKTKMMADAFNYFDDDGSSELDLYEFTNHLLTQQFRDKLFVASPQIQNKVQAWLECNIFRRYRFHIIILITFVMPSFTISLMQNLKNINNKWFDIILLISFFLNLLEIHIRWFSFGYRRFFDLKRYPNPPYVVAAISKYTKTVNLSDEYINADDLIIRLDSSQRHWAVHHLRDTRPLSILDKSTLSIIHRIEFVVIWFTFLSWFMATIIHPTQETQGYQRYFLQLGILIRIFTLLRSNQKIIYMIFTVFSAFASLFAFLFILIYVFARVGCTLFGQKKDIVIDDIYPVSSSIIASFDTTGSAMLALLQLMIGEGWHEVMYVNVIAQNVLYSLYFIVYILIVTIIISNVFVGLFLSDVDELKKSQSDDELKKKFNKSNNFKQYALNKLEKLNYQLNKLKNHEIKMKKQIQKIQNLLATQQMNDLQKQQLAGIQQINRVNPNTQFNVIQQ